MSDAPPTKLVPCGGAIAAACGGHFKEKCTIVVTGRAGSRKSTGVSAIVLELLRRGWSTLVCDAEMDVELARDTFVRVGATHEELGRLTRVEVRSSKDVFDAIAAHRPQVVAVDSLHRIARRPSEQEMVLEALEEEGTRRLVFVILHANAKGHAHGGGQNEHPGDAVVECARGGTASAVKCRWHAVSGESDSTPASSSPRTRPPSRGRRLDS